MKLLTNESRPYVALTDAATIAVNAALGNRFSFTFVSNNRTMGNPTNAVNGAQIIFRIKQNAGSNTITWGSDYRFSTSLPSPTLSTGAGKVDYIGFEYNSADSKWDCLAQNIGFG
ncbi:MAG: hypothetical protein ABFD50_08175 [Smithella sp.]